MVFAAKLSLPTGNTSMSDNKEASKAESQETSEISEDKILLICCFFILLPLKDISTAYIIA